MLLKPLAKVSRDTWEENIEKVLSRNESKEDIALLDDSDLEDYT